MLEGTPGYPYGQNGLEDLTKIEESMKIRRETVEKLLQPDERLLSATVYPLLGSTQLGTSFTSPESFPGGMYARSLFTSDNLIHPHHRFKTLTKNIRERRTENVFMRYPLFQDQNTTRDPLPIPPVEGIRTPDIEPGYIYMDSMAFGMGNCCLQITFQCCNMQEAMLFYDSLSPLCPILLSISASAPIYRGYLSDWDARWNSIVGSVDDRTPTERGVDQEAPNDNVKSRTQKNEGNSVSKSRYDTIDCYISDTPKLKEAYHDTNMKKNEAVEKTLLEEGIPPRLAAHVAHLFIRDPLVIYRDKLLMDNNTHVDHFENIQSTNWNNVRFKPPPPNSDIGWRVEFRPLDLQYTEFENAAFTVFVVLMSRVISTFELNLYVPISKNDDNMQKAHLRNSVLTQKFFFRTDTSVNSKEEFGLYTTNEIMNGKTINDKKYPGLLELCEIYLDTITIEKNTRDKLSTYLTFLSKRASGELITPAAWVRKFVADHPDYKKDSVINHSINYDLMQAIHDISTGKNRPKEMYGDFVF